MPKLNLAAYLLLFFTSPLLAQREDLTRDQAFFHQQEILYQQWLDHSGLGKTLHVRTAEVEPQQAAALAMGKFGKRDATTSERCLFTPGAAGRKQRF